MECTHYRRADVTDETYFITVNLAKRKRTLLEDHIDDLRSAMKKVKAMHPFHIDAIVILSDLLHAVWTLPPNDAAFGIRWAMIKRFVTKVCAPVLQRDDRMNKSKRHRKESTIWQRRF